MTDVIKFGQKLEVVHERKRIARRTDPSGSVAREFLTCTNCLLPFSLEAFAHCQCTIWDVGKRPVDASGKP